MATSTAPIRVFTDAENRHIDECYAFVLRLCREAGALVREGFAAVNKSIATKEGSWDLVTRYDQDVEKLLIGGIAAVYPEHRFVAEETAAQNQLSDAPTWIIDPIDGTVNFVHGIPLVAISIALLVRQEIAIGVVYNPITGELYRCRKGAGAFLNDAPIRCSEVSDLDGAIYAHEVSFMRAERVREKNLKRIHKFASLAQGVRSFGCAALTLAYVARGAIDGYQIDDLKPWDVAAGALLIREAGGTVYSTDGRPFDVMRAHLVCAGTEALCQQLIAGIREAERWRVSIG